MTEQRGVLTATVDLDAIRFDAGTQVRASINETVVTNYAERMSEGVVFPPVVLFHDGNHHYLADGFHRCLASQRLGLRGIAATITPGTVTDALWYALGANRTNGHQMTAADKRQAIVMALKNFYFGRDLAEKSTREIAQQIGCDPGYVARIKLEQDQVLTQSAPDRVLGKDGKRYPASKPRTSDRPDAPRSKSAVTQRKQDIRDLAARGFSTRQIASQLDVTESACRKIASSEGIVVHADRAIGRTQRHDSNRIAAAIVMDAENLLADANLIEIDSLDRARLSPWIETLTAARRSLDQFIRKLTKEQERHVEKAS